MSYHPDEYDLERSHEMERRLDRDSEREPFGRRSRRQRGPRYFSGLVFQTLPPIPVVASVVGEERTSYIRRCDSTAGHVDHRSNPKDHEGRDPTRSYRGTQNVESDGGGGDGAVSGVAA